MNTYTVKDRFIKYVQIDTEADPYSGTVPSSIKQKDLTKIVLQELQELGITAETNDAGYVYATLPANVEGVKPIFFCSHFDTAPDCSGSHVKPIVHSNYQGEDIVLPDDNSQVISKSKYPYLAKKIGDDIITASGLTLLGSDDKSGVAIIMDALHHLKSNPHILHGPITALFTTDEEIGKGVAQLDKSKLIADFGFTLDGGELGTIEAENFSADGAVIRIHGVSAHPCCAKGTMESAIKIAADIIAALPRLNCSPETTTDYEGFIHPNKVESALESAELRFILRDFKTENLTVYAGMLDDICKTVLANYPNSTYELTTHTQYRNMSDVVNKHPYILDIAHQAMDNVGIPPRPEKIRGGTDGSVLSHLGYPCPNLFTGMQAIHSKHEWISVQDMQKSVDTVVEICRLVAILKS